MGCMTDSDRNVLRPIPPQIRGEILFCYLYRGMSQQQISYVVLGKALNDPWAAQVISTVLRAYGFHQGRQRGKYPHVPREKTLAFAYAYAPEMYANGLEEGTYDEFLRRGENAEEEDDFELDMDTDADIDFDGIFTPQQHSVPSNVRSYSIPSNARQRVSPNPRKKPGFDWNIDWDFRLSDLPWRAIGILAAVSVLIAVIPSLFNTGKSLLDRAGSFVSTEYELEIFTYQNKQYAGNQRFNKPDGLCFRPDSGAYTMGDFSGSDLDGYGIITGQNGELLQMGTFKNSRQNGYGICRGGDNVFYVGKFKNGTLKGYGYCYNNGVEQLVKFKSVDADNAQYSGSVELIAQKIGSSWYTEKGKALNMKNSTYKGITSIGDSRIRIDDMEFYFGSGNTAQFSDSDTALTWRYGFGSYNNSGNGLKMEYAGSGLTVHHTYRYGNTTATNVYSATLSTR